MPATIIQTHIADAESRLLSQFQGKPRITGLVAAYAFECQLIENAAFQVLNGRFLSNASGATLDNIATLVAARPRGSMTDAQFKPVVLGTILANNSDGTSATLNNVATTLFGASKVFLRTPQSLPGSSKHLAATISLGIGSPTASPMYYGLLFGIFNSAVAAGIAVASLYSFNASGCFACAGPQSYVMGLDDGTGTVGGGLAQGIYNFTSL